MNVFLPSGRAEDMLFSIRQPALRYVIQRSPPTWLMVVQVVHIYSEMVSRNIPIEDFDFDVATRQFIVADHSGCVWSFLLSQDCEL
jgi:hypothetical protein